MPEFHFGIDFGTTNSAVVALEVKPTGDRYHAISGGNADPVPSILAYAADGRVRVGAEVRKNLINIREGGFETVVESVKTAIESRGDIYGKAPVAIAADLLRYLSNLAESDVAVGQRIERAVFAIPVGWSAARRARLRQAARSAGIDVAGFISEPTAALLAMHRDFRRHECVVVFDWGGGTLDVSVLRRGDLGWEEVAKRGLPKAGDFIDDRVARVLHQRIVRAKGIDAAFEDVDAETRQILVNRAEELKRRLQRRGGGSERVSLLRYGIVGAARVDSPVTELSSKELDGILEPIVDEAITCLEETVREAGISREQVGALLVIGGSSQLGLLRSRLEADAGWATQYGPVIAAESTADELTTKPAWLVARGAAILSRRGGRCARLSDDLGLLVADAEQPFFKILKRGARASEARQPRSHVFGLVEDTTTATFVVAARKHDGRVVRVDEIGLAVKGFSSERLHFGLFVDDDDIVQGRAESENLPKRSETALLENVRWAYDVGAFERGGG